MKKAIYIAIPLVIALALVMALPGCGGGQPTATPSPEKPGSKILEVMNRQQDALMSIPGVVGVGIGRSEATGEFVILVMVKQLTPELKKALPKELEGFKVEPLVTGEIEIQPAQ